MSVANKTVPMVPEYPITAVGWKVLVKPIKIEEKTKGGIYLADEARRAKGHLRYIGQVISMGPLCYKDAAFHGEEFCKVGDWVVFGAYDGQIIEVHMPEDQDANDQGLIQLRLLTDKAIQAVVQDPSRFRIYCD